MSPQEIINEYPDLVLEDIQESLHYAAWLAEDQVNSLTG
jgi:uncharacterized protein (DUF433 family)